MRRRRGPGRIRIKLSEIIKDALGCQCDPQDIWQNNYPAAKWLDLARWGVDCRFAEGLKNVHSWDTMSDCVNRGIVIVDKDLFSIEVCGGKK